MIKEGTLWDSVDGKKFRIIHIVEQQGHTWVHYRNEPQGLFKEPIKEFSCYIESFQQRFNPIPE